MSLDARRRLVLFVKDRVAITADMSNDDINAAVRAIQDEFKALAGADPDLFHETCQAALRSVVRHLSSDVDDVPDYVKARREGGFHQYVARE